jgi:hypothetical protein
MRKTLLVVLLAVVGLGCQEEKKATQAKEEVPWDPEEYVVYNTIIREEKARAEDPIGGIRLDIRVIVMHEQTGTQADDLPPPSYRPWPPFLPEELRGEESEEERAERLWRERFLRPEVEGAGSEPVEDFARKNRVVYSLSNRFKVDVPVVLLKKEKWSELAALDPEPGGHRGWRRFRKEYPYSLGILRLSRVGFDRQRQQALVYVSNYVYGGGASYYALLTMKGGSWVIENKKDAFPRD